VEQQGKRVTVREMIWGMLLRMASSYGETLFDILLLALVGRLWKILYEREWYQIIYAHLALFYALMEVK
jgi:hypothetical protein